MLNNLKALKLESFGALVDVATEDFPYHHTRILTTSYPAAKAPRENTIEGGIIHGSVISNANVDRWKQVWTYLLTEKTP